MDIEVIQANDVTVVAPRGDLDMAVAGDLRRTLVDLIDRGRHRLVVDLAAVPYVDSSGMGALVAALKHARTQGGDLRLAALQEDVRAVFALTRLDRAINIGSTRQDALASW
jgi:anti-sigma B factor antagonist